MYLYTKKNFYDLFDKIIKDNNMLDNTNFINSNIKDIFILSELAFIRSIEVFVDFFISRQLSKKEIDRIFFSNYDIQGIFISFLNLFLERRLYLKKLIRDINIVLLEYDAKYDWGVHHELISIYAQLPNHRYITDKTYSHNFRRSRFFLNQVIADSINSLYNNAKNKTFLLLACLYTIKQIYKLNIIDTVITYDILSEIKEYFINEILTNSEEGIDKIYKNMNNNFQSVFKNNMIDKYIQKFKDSINLSYYIHI